jgi:hypothetical protein
MKDFDGYPTSSTEEPSREFGWLKWIYTSPKDFMRGDHHPIEVWSFCDPFHTVLRYTDLSPELNVSSLYWRPTGIFKEFTSWPTSTRPPGDQQANLMCQQSGAARGASRSPTMSRFLGMGYNLEENNNRSFAIWPYPYNDHP